MLQEHQSFFCHIKMTGALWHKHYLLIYDPLVVDTQKSMFWLLDRRYGFGMQGFSAIPPTQAFLIVLKGKV